MSDVGLSSKIPIIGISSPISLDSELKFLLLPLKGPKRPKFQLCSILMKIGMNVPLDKVTHL